MKLIILFLLSTSFASFHPYDVKGLVTKKILISKPYYNKPTNHSKYSFSVLVLKININSKNISFVKNPYLSSLDKIEFKPSCFRLYYYALEEDYIRQQVNSVLKKHKLDGLYKECKTKKGAKRRRNINLSDMNLKIDLLIAKGVYQEVFSFKKGEIKRRSKDSSKFHVQELVCVSSPFFFVHQYYENIKKHILNKLNIRITPHNTLALEFSLQSRRENIRIELKIPTLKIKNDRKLFFCEGDFIFVSPTNFVFNLMFYRQISID